MRLDGWRAGQSHSLQAEVCNFPPQRFCIDLADDERSACEFASSGFKRLLGGFDRCLFQAVAKSAKSGIGIGVDHKG